jgi:hypothetical protein
MWPLDSQDGGSSFASHFLSFFGVVVVALLINAFRKGYQVRKKFQALKDQGIVSLPILV